MYVPLVGGKKASMPRYYKEKLYFDAERRFVQQFIAEKIELENALKFRKLSDKEKDVFYWNENQAKEAAFRRASVNQYKNLKL